MTKSYQVYYNGTVLFQEMEGDGTLERDQAKRTIEMFLREGQSLDKIKTFIKNQMDEMEDHLVRANRQYPRDPAKGLKALKNYTKMSRDRFVYTWVRNVWMLIILKVIEDDEMNGFVFFEKRGNTLVIKRNG